MPSSAQSLHQSAIVAAFSTFVESAAAAAAEKEAALLLLLDWLKTKKDLDTWTAAAAAAFTQAKLKAGLTSTDAAKLLTQFVQQSPPYQTSVFLQQYLLALQNSNCSPSTIKNYRSDISQFFNFANVKRLNQLLQKPVLLAFIKNQRKKGLKTSSIKRKLISIAQFGAWVEDQGIVAGVSLWLTPLSQAWPNEPPKTRKPNVANLSRQNLLNRLGKSATARKTQDFRARLGSALSSLKVSQPIPRRQLLPYLNLAMIVLFLLGAGIFGYQQFNRDVPTPLAYPTTLTRPNRDLSFQGRLTDTAYNPITSATNMQFKLYDNVTGGSLLWESGTCSITPDQDGIFTSNLGDDCGSEITDDVFTENANVWLEVTIAAETLDPRQPIKSVAYALNAETVQGYPASASAVENTVIVMDNNGEIVLGNATPVLKSTGASFAIEAQALTLQTSSGSDGDITLSPDGTGRVNINSDLALDGFLAAPGATLSANYAEGVALVLKGGPSGTADIQQWQDSAGTVLSVVDSAGNVGIGTSDPGELLDVDAGNIRLDSDYAITWDTAGKGIEAQSGDSYIHQWTPSGFRFYLDTNNNSTDSFEIYGNVAEGTTTGAKFVVQDDGSVGIGTTSPGGLLDVGASSQFRVDLNGDLIKIKNVAYSWPSSQAAAANYVLTNDGSGNLSWAEGGVGGGYWALAENVFYPKDEYAEVVDLILGGDATSSADIHLYSDGRAVFNEQGLDSDFRVEGVGQANALFVQGSDGNVGIGTSGPSDELEVYAASNPGIIVKSNSTSTETRLRFNDGTNWFSTGIENNTYKIYPGSTLGDTGLNLDSAGNVGIGTTAPGAPLEVSKTGVQVSTSDFYKIAQLGNGVIDGLMIGYDASAPGVASIVAPFGEKDLAFWTKQTSGSWSEKMRLTETGNVGIGTTSPSELLVVGDDYSSTANGNVISVGNLTGNSRLHLGQLNTRRMQMDWIYNATLDDAYGQIITASYSNPIFIDASKLLLQSQSGGNVGIGTTSPSSFKLETAGSIGPSADSSYDLGSLAKAWANIYGDTIYQGGNQVCDDSGNCTNSGLWQNTLNVFHPRDEFASVVDLTLGGTATASADIHLMADGSAVFNEQGNDADFRIEGSGATNAFFVQGSDGNVGIGTTGPASILHISQTSAGALGPIAILQNPGTTTGTGSSLAFTLGTAGTSGNWIGQISAVSSLNQSDSYLAFSTRGSNAFGERVRIDNQGNVGIGTTNPGGKLDVAGDGLTLSKITAASDTSYYRPDLNFARSRGTLASKTIVASGDYLGLVRWSGYDGTDLNGYAAEIGAYVDGTPGMDDLPGRLVFSTSADGSNSPTERMRIDSTGNVGIGSTSPGKLLDIAGTLRASGQVTFTNLTASSAVYTDASSNLTTTPPTGGTLGYWTRVAGNLYPATTNDTLSATSSASTVATFTGTGSSDVLLVQDEADDTSPFVVDATGNVGIGTTGALSKLHVAGNIRAYDTSGTYYSGLGEANSSWGYLSTNAGMWYMNKELRVDTGNIGSYNENLSLKTSGTTRITVQNSDGNVGIGTTTPASPLHVWGNVELGNGGSIKGASTDFSLYTLAQGDYHHHFYSRESTGVASERFRIEGGADIDDVLVLNSNFNVNSGQLYVQQSSGNVGIGSTSPNSILDIYDTTTADVRIDTDVSNVYGLRVESNSMSLRDFSNGKNIVTINAGGGFNVYNTDGDTVIRNPNSSDDVYLVQANGGNVGIGTTNPLYKLHLYLNSSSVTDGVQIDQDGTGDAVLNFDLTSTEGWTMGIDNSDGDKFKLCDDGGAGVGGGDCPIVVETTPGSNALYIDTNGNVGIGTTSPGAKLDIQGDIKIVDGTQAAGYVLTSDASGLASWTDVSSTAGPWTLTGNNLYPDNTGYNVAIGATDAGTAKLYVNGNVGIGTTAPANALAVISTTTPQLRVGYDNTTNYLTTAVSSAGAVTLDAAGSSAGFTFNDPVTLIAAKDLTLASGTGRYIQTFTGTTTNAMSSTANSLTTGTALNLSSTATAFSSGKMLSISKTGASGSTAFTGDIANLTYTQTFNGGIGLNSTGNALDISRAITLNNAGNTHTVSGALLTLSDSGTQTAGTLAHTASVIDATQNYTASTGTAFYFKNYGAGDSFRVDDVSGDTSPFVIDAGGNVGIGSASPSYNLDVVGTTGIRVNDGASGGSITLVSSGTGVSVGTFGSSGRIAGEASIFRVGSINRDLRLAGGAAGQTDYVTVQNTSGNLGIGTTSPGYQLDVVSGDAIAARFDGRVIGSDAVNSTEFVTKSQLDALSTGSGIWTDTTPGAGSGIVYLTSATDDLVVGGTTLVAPFSVDESANTVRIGEGSGSNAILNMYASDGDTGSITYTTNDSWAFEGGNVGIGSTSPGTALDVVGTGRFSTGIDANAASTIHSLTLDGNTGTALNISGTSFGTDINLQNGETIDNDTNGRIKFTGDTLVSGTSYFANGTSYYVNGSGTANLNTAQAYNFTINNGSSTGGIQPAGGATAIFNKDFYSDYLQFNPPDTAEYKSGGSWSSTTVPSTLFKGGVQGSAAITNGWEGYRVTWSSFPYRYLEALFTAWSAQGHTMTIMVETSPDGAAWTTQFTTSSVSGWPGTNTYKQAFSTSGNPYLRITFTPTWNPSYPSNNIILYNIRYFGGYPTYSQTQLYSWDENRNITMPASLSVNTDVSIGGIALSTNTNVNSGASKIGLYDDSMTYIAGNTNVQSAIKQLDTAIGTVSGSAGGWTDDGTVVRLTTSTDNVGIGTTNPGTYKLYVEGSQYISGVLIGNPGANYASFNAYTVSDPGANEGYGFTGTSAGWTMDVSPLARTNADGNLNFYGTANNIALWRPQLWVYNASNYTTATAQSSGGLDFTNTGGHITFNPTGNVGIGTTSPAQKLHVYNGSGQFDTVRTDKSTILVVDSHPLPISTSSSNPTYLLLARTADVYNTSITGTIHGNRTDRPDGGALIDFNFGRYSTSVPSLTFNMLAGGRATTNTYSPTPVLITYNGTEYYALKFSGSWNSAWSSGTAVADLRIYAPTSGNRDDSLSYIQLRGDLVSGESSWTMTTSMVSMGEDLYVRRNVGIGSTSPGTALDVVGTGRFSTGIDANAASTIHSLTLDGNTGTALNISGTSFGTDINLQNGETIDNDTNGIINFKDGSNSLAQFYDAGTVGNLFVTGGISTYDTTVTDGYVEASGICLGNGTNCITSWSGVGYTASNGLTLTGQDIELGGTLEKNTDIATAGYNLTISGTGNVGIGTTSPNAAQLQIHNASAGLTYLAGLKGTTNTIGDGVAIGLTNDGSSSNWWKSAIAYERTTSYGRGSIHFLQENTADTSNADLTDSVMTIEADGHVGIGTTTPAYKLHLYLNSSSATDGIQIDQDGTGDAVLNFDLTSTEGWTMGIDNSDSDKFKLCDDGGVGVGSGDCPIVVETTPGSNALYIDTNGNVGIGSTSPGNKLDIDTNSNTSGIALDNRESLTGYSGDNWLRLNQSSEWASGVYTPGLMRADGGFNVDNTTAIDNVNRYHYSGNTSVNKWGAVNSSGFGIDALNSGDWDLLIYESQTYTSNLALGYVGTAVLSTYDTNEALYIRANGSGNINIMDSGTGDVAIDTDTLYIDNSANRVGIGTTGPSYKLDVSGTGRFTGAVDLDADLELNSTLTDINGSVGTSGQILSSTGTGVDWIDISSIGYDYWQIQGDTGGPTNVTDGYLVDFEGGEGIDTAFTANKLTISGEDATISNKGIASFSDSYFSVSSGAVSIDDIYLLNTGDTGTGAYTFSGGIFSVNASSNFATNINTGTSTGAVSIGGNLNTVAIDSSSWDINSAGVGSGFTQLTVDNLRLDGNTLSSTTGAVTLQPLSGQNLNVTLATTGDFAVNTNQLYVDTSAGNVGIGTVSPSSKFEVAGDIRLTGDIYKTGDLTIDSSTDLIFDADGADIYFKDGGITRGRIDLTPVSVTQDQSCESACNQAWYYTSNYLDSDIEYYGQSFTVGTGKEGALTKITLKLYRIGSDADATLVVELREWNVSTGKPGSVMATSTSKTFNSITTSSSGVDYEFTFSSPASVIANTKYAFNLRCTNCSGSDVALRYDNYPDNYSGGEQFSSWDSGSTWSVGTTEDLYFITYTGSPNDYGKLLMGRVDLVNADLAENYPTLDQTLSAGEIVIIDTQTGSICVETKEINTEYTIRCEKTKPAQVPFVAKTKGNSADRKLLLGVVSTKPGITLGGFAAKDFIHYKNVPVALAGRVPVTMSRSSQPVKSGDYITSSGEPGKGTKLIGAGFVVGRALENWSPSAQSDELLLFVETGWVDSTDDGLLLVSDYVFDANYNKLSLEALNSYLQQNKHLPGLLSSFDANAWGNISIQTSDMKLLEKIEENTLYVLENHQRLKNLEHLDLRNTDGYKLAKVDNQYQVTPVGSGSILDKALAVSSGLIGQLKAGLVDTQQLIVTGSGQIADLSVNTLKVSGQTIQDLISNAVTQEVRDQLATLPSSTPDLDLANPLAETSPTPSPSALLTPTPTVSLLGELLADSVQTATLSATNISSTNIKTDELSTNSLVADETRLGSLLATDVSVSGELNVQGELSASSARIAALEAGMAQLDAVRANTAELVTATVSGTLYADNIDQLEAKIAAALKKPELADLLTGQATSASEATVSASLSELVATVESAGFTATSAAELNLTPADLGLTGEDVVLTADAAFIDRYFKVNGSGYVADALGVGQQLLVGGQINVGSRVTLTENYLAFTPAVDGSGLNLFQIQPSGQGTLALLGDLMVLDDSGQVVINGDAYIAGNVQVEDTLLADLLQPTDFGNPFQVQVAGLSTDASGSAIKKESRFEIVNELGAPVATISAQGKAHFAGGIGVDADNLGAPSSSASAELAASKTSGRATIPAGSSQLTINHPEISADSLIYVTPLGSTGNRVLYVKSQTPAQVLTTTNPDGSSSQSTTPGSFIVGFDSPAPQAVEFNWWIVN